MRLDHQPANGAKDTNASVRRHTRALFSVPVTLRHLVTGEIRTTRGISLDISTGGLGALVQGALPVGERVEIDLDLREHPLRTVGIVRHSCSRQSGFEFLRLTAEERLKIANVMGHA